MFALLQAEEIRKLGMKERETALAQVRCGSYTRCCTCCRCHRHCCRPSCRPPFQLFLMMSPPQLLPLPLPLWRVLLQPSCKVRLVASVAAPSAPQLAMDGWMAHNRTWQHSK